MKGWRRLGLGGGALALGLLAILARAALAGAPALVSYQGVLTLDDGTVVEDGAYTLTFRLCDAAAAGTCTVGQQLQVEVADGLYNVLLSDPALIDDLRSATYPYLEVRVDAGPAGVPAPFTLLPRQEIASVPYALVAGTASDAAASSTAACPGVPGTLRYVIDPPGLEVCDGNVWVPVGFRRLDEEVFNAAAPTSWTTLSLGAHTGPGPAVVYLRVVSPSSDPFVAFRPSGDGADWFYGQTWPHGAAMTTGGAGKPSLVVMMTDANGDLEWRAGGTATTEIRLLGFVR